MKPITILWLALAAFVGLVAGLQCNDDADAYELLPAPYRVTMPVTYQCGYPELAAAVAAWDAASEYVSDGGCSLSPQIKLRYYPNVVWDALTIVVASYRNCHAKPDGYIECRESVRTTPGVVSVLAHEVGHTFGLSHTTDPSAVMNAAPCEKPDRNTYVNCNGISADDLAGITWLYGPRPSTPTATPTQATPTATATTPTPTQTAQPTVSATPTRTSTRTPTATPSPTQTSVSRETPAAPTATPTRAPRYRVVVGGLVTQ